ncbi:rhodanese-like domain-containing protein [Stieleria sp.]|uniref:rhodanese-like domain-containing protein n=1 Tax=Stieleria sp. TaxID=2795976 RepID=UPI00356645ED
MIRKSWFGILALAICGLASHPAPAQFGGLFGGPKIETISTDELQSLLKKQQQAAADAKAAGHDAPPADFVVVDVRSDAEVDVSIIPGAITKKQYEANLEDYQGRTVIPYCTVGGRSGAYAKQLAAKGVKVKNYKGSILKWVDAELPLVTLDGKPTNRVHTYSDRYKIPSKYEQVTQ